MKLSNEQFIFSDNVWKLLKHVYDKGYSCSLGEAYRTPEQAAVYASQGKGIKDSLHCKRLAIDLNLFSPEGVFLTTVADHKFLGDYWKTLHHLNGWGGDWTTGDANHYQMKEG